MHVPSDSEKESVWTAYRAGHPTRVPLRWNVNPRIILLNPELNPEGYTFDQYWHDPEAIAVIQSRFQEYVATTLSRCSDGSSKLPDRWNFRVDDQNTYDGAYFGTPVVFEPGQCPSNRPCMTESDADAFLARDFSRPLDNPWIKEKLALHAELTRVARDFTYLGRGGDVAPFTLGFDGPLTIGAVLMGADIFSLLAGDPTKAVRFMKTLMEAVLARNKALADIGGGWRKTEWGGLADDSIQLISAAMYEELILPLHEWWYDQTSDTTAASRKRSIHLCGDVARHFRSIHEKLGVVSFDTGFPLDHGAVRRVLGPTVEISGGPHVALLRDGTPEACAHRTREILQSGIMEGGRFILQEGNNLPPCCPLDNLAAVYETCLQFGRYR
jgi:uroporphyrinogen-III decarboxylase